MATKKASAPSTGAAKTTPSAPPAGALQFTIFTATVPDRLTKVLTLTPDARKGLLRISAEARNLEAMLEFHRLLEASDELSDVSLLNHEIVAQSAEHPVQFNLSATWEMGDANP